MIKYGFVKKAVAMALCFAMLSQVAPLAAEGDDIEKTEKPKYDTTELIVKYKDNANKESIKSTVKVKTMNIFLETKKKLKNNENIEVINVNSVDNICVKGTGLLTHN